MASPGRGAPLGLYLVLRYPGVPRPHALEEGLKAAWLQELALEVARRLARWLEEDQEALEELRLMAAVEGLRAARGMS